MQRVTDLRKIEIQRLRVAGLSIPEIVASTGEAKTTVTRYVKGVVIPSELVQRLREKQGGSKERARGLRENVMEKALAQSSVMTDRERFFLFVGLYWGEGTKKDFTIINSDPKLIQTSIVSLRAMGISKERLSLSLRVHSDVSVAKAKHFWSTITGISESFIRRIEIIEGKKKGKLPHGMCRIRVNSGIQERLLIQSSIEVIGKDANNKLLSS